MTSTTLLLSGIPTAAVTLAVLGDTAPSAELLRAALPTASICSWQVVQGATPSAEIALCDTTESIRTALERWPDVAVVALVPARDDENAVLTALNAGASVCVRGAEAPVVAAYLQSVARRQGLLGDGSVR
jgi:DNA-binding NarL/FixJ family response regulator